MTRTIKKKEKRQKKAEDNKMDINLLFKIAAIGILVAVLHQVLVRAGREDQAMMTTLARISNSINYGNKGNKHTL